MRQLGVPVAEAASLLTALDPEAGRPDAADAAVRFARAAWSCLAEPGDGIAGRLLELLGPVAALAAVEEGDAEGVVFALPSGAGPVPSLADVRAGLDRWRPRLDGAAVVRALRQAQRFGARLLVPGDDAWPDGLDDLGPHRPAALWLRGDPAVLAAAGSASIALVGARAASGYGEHVAVEVAAGLVDRGYAVVSGAAYGIDGAAHRSALASGGATVAVLAGGLDRFYPSGHEALLGRIVERGAVIAEVPFGASPSKWRFLQRNRLIAAIAHATVVVEAGWRSGSLNTAGHAAALGRPLGAVPGPVTSSTSAGCHRLLREYDAVCVTTAEEMAELAPVEPVDPGGAREATRERSTLEGSTASARSGPAPASDPGRRPRDPDGVRTRLLDALSTRTARSAMQVARDSGLAPDRVRAELGLLELEGLAIDRGTGWIKAAGA